MGTIKFNEPTEAEAAPSVVASGIQFNEPAEPRKFAPPISQQPLPTTPPPSTYKAPDPVVPITDAAPNQAEQFLSDAVRAGQKRVSDAAGAVGRAWLGEGAQLEFPDAPELTEADIGFFESFMPNIKLGLTVNPVEKAGILQSHFADDPRFGGAFQDKFNNPLIVWEGKNYYINKPGASTQDLNDLVAQGIQYLPATRFASKAGGALGLVGRGLPAYAATDLAQQAGTMMSGGKPNMNLTQAAATSGIGSGVDLGLKALGYPARFVSKIAGEPVRRAVTGAKQMMPRVFPQRTKSPYPMTKGQRYGNDALLEEEELIRRSGQYGQGATDKLKQFDETQRTAIETDAAAKQQSMGAGTGLAAGSDIAAGEVFEEGLKAGAKSKKSAATNAFTVVRDAPAVFMERVGIQNLTQSMLDSVADYGPRQLANLSGALKSNVDYLKKLNKLAQNPRFKAQSFKRLEDFRKGLNIDIKGATDDATKHGLIAIKKSLDDGLDVAITEGLFKGDIHVVEMLKKANSLWRNYKQAAGDRGGDAVDKLLNAVVNDQKSALETLTAIMGANVVDKGVGINLVKRLKAAYPNDSQAIRLLKDAVLYRTLVGGAAGQTRVTRAAIVKQFEKNFKTKGKQFTNELFSDAEIKELGKFVDDVIPTLPAEILKNASGSGHMILGALKSRGMLGAIGHTMKVVPFVDQMGQGLSNVAGSARASHLISQFEAPLMQPLVSATAIGGSKEQ